MVRGGPDGPRWAGWPNAPLGPPSAGPGMHTISKRVHGPISELGFSRPRAHDFETRARATKTCVCKSMHL